MIIIELLIGIKKKEQNILRSFITQPYWKLQEEDKEFFEAMIKWPKKMQKVHGEYSKKTDKLSSIKGRLILAIEGYLYLENSRKYPFYQDLMLLDYYNNEGMEACYKSKEKQLKKNLQKYPVDNEHNFFRFRMNEIAASRAKQRREKMLELVEMLKSLKQFYVENELRIFCEFQTQKKIIKTDYPISERSSMEQTSSLAQLYQQVYNLHTEVNSEKYYTSLKSVAIGNELNLSKEVLHTLHSHLLNYCIQHLNQGGGYFAEQYILLVESLIKHKLLLDKGILDWGRYGNIVTVYLLLGEKAAGKARLFIDKYTKCLVEKNQKYVKVLNLARIYLFENNWQASDEQLLLIQREYHQLSSESKVLYKKLELKIAYLNKETLLMDSYLKNFRALVSNTKKLEKNKREVLRSFASCFHRLIDDKLEKSFVESKTLAATDKHWLLSML